MLDKPKRGRGRPKRKGPPPEPVERLERRAAMLWYSRIGERVRMLRKSISMSQRDLCAAARIEHEYLSRLENGKAPIKLGRLIRLAEALKVPPAYMLDEDLDDQRLFLYRLTEGVELTEARQDALTALVLSWAPSEPQPQPASQPAP